MFFKNSNTGEKPKFEKDFEGDLYLARRKTEKSMSFGMESGKLNKKSASWSFDGVGGDGKWTFGNSKNAGIFKANGSFGHIEGGYSYDATHRIPGVKLNGDANVANFKAQALLRKSGIEHEIASGEIKALDAHAKVAAGGDTVFPYASVGANTVSVEAGVGPMKYGFGDGAKMSANGDLLSLGGEKNVGGSGKVEYNPLSAKANGNNTLFNESSKTLSGIGSVEKDANGNRTIKTDFSTGGLSDYHEYSDYLKGRGGEETGSAEDVFSSHFNRGSLIREAESQHKSNGKTFNRYDGKDTWFSRRNNNRAADKSSGLVDRLNGAIDQSENQKREIDRKLADPNLSEKDKKKLSKQSNQLSEDISKMQEARNNLSSDRDRANDNLNRYYGDRDLTNKSTDRIVSEAKANAQEVENVYDKHGWSQRLGNPAIGVCNSRNELNGRIHDLDNHIEDNNAQIDLIGKTRDDYLKENGMTLSDAIAAGDQRISDLNGYERALRNENQDYRNQKAECKKALLETDKTFGAGDSEEIRAKGRDLEAAKLDNENRIAAVDDKIADYCNSHGITKDSDGNYPSDKTQTSDKGLQDLLDEKKALEDKQAENQKDIDINKKDIADAENKEKTGFTIKENDGNAQLDFVEEKYGKHIQDNKDIRDGKKAENGSDHTTPPPPPPPGGGGAGSDGGNGSNDGSTESQGTSQTNSQIANESAVAANDFVADNTDSYDIAPSGPDRAGDLDKADPDVEPLENSSDLSAQSDDATVNSAPAEGEGPDAVNELSSEGEDSAAKQNDGLPAGNAAEESEPKEETSAEDEGKDASAENETQSDGVGEDTESKDVSKIEGEDKGTAPEEVSQSELESEDNAPEESAPEEAHQTEDQSEEAAPSEESPSEGEGEETAPEETAPTGDDGGDDTQEEDPKYEEENQEEVPEETQSESTENMPAEEAPVVNGEEAAPEEQSQAEGEDIAPEEESQSEGEDEENAPEEESQGEGESEEDAPQESQSDGEAEGTEEAEAEGQDQEPEEQSDEEGMDSDGKDNGSEITAADANEISGAPEETSDGMSTTSADEVSGEPQEEADGMSTTGYAEGTGESLGSSDGMSLTNESDGPDESMSSSEGMSTTADGQTESAPEVSSGESMDSGQSM